MKEKEPKPLQERNAVRVTFSFQEDDVARIDGLRRRLGHGIDFVNKSEVVRLGLLALEGLPEKRALKLADDLRRLKVGRRPNEDAEL